MERQSPERGQSAEISFGTVYTFKDKEERREIIIDIGENNTFHSSRLFRTKDGTFGFLFPGTSNPRNIRRIECVWSIEEVIEAAIKGYLEKNEFKPPESYINMLRKLSRQGSRIIRF